FHVAGKPAQRYELVNRSTTKGELWVNKKGSCRYHNCHRYFVWCRWVRLLLLWANSGSHQRGTEETSGRAEEKRNRGVDKKDNWMRNTWYTACRKKWKKCRQE